MAVIRGITDGYKGDCRRKERGITDAYTGYHRRKLVFTFCINRVFGPLNVLTDSNNLFNALPLRSGAP